VATDNFPEKYRDHVLGLLDEEERARALRFVFPHDALAFAVGRALVRRILAAHRPPPSGGWRFVMNPYGRPELPDPGDPPLSFSLSHCRGLVAASCAPARAIGIDVERLDRDCAFLDIARSFYSPAEVEALAALPPERRREAFFDFWTLKESYIKARGLGLSIPLAEFSFTLDPLAIRFSAQIDDDPARWQFWQTHPVVGCRLAAAVSRTAGEQIGMTCRLLPVEVLLGTAPLE